MLFHGFVGQPVKTTGLSVVRDLTIECRRIELFEPRAKLRQLRRRQAFDGFFDVFDIGHAENIAQPRVCAYSPKYAFRTSGLVAISEALPCISTRPVCRI